MTRILPGGSDPETFDITPDGATLFVSNEDANSASIVDVASGKVRLHGTRSAGSRKGSGCIPMVQRCGSPVRPTTI